LADDDMFGNSVENFGSQSPCGVHACKIDRFMDSDTVFG
jgi:hypothetical protein